MRSLLSEPPYAKICSERGWAPTEGPLEGALGAGGTPTRGLTFVIQVLFFLWHQHGRLLCELYRHVVWVNERVSSYRKIVKARKHSWLQRSFVHNQVRCLDETKAPSPSPSGNEVYEVGIGICSMSGSFVVVFRQSSLDLMGFTIACDAYVERP